MIQDLRSVIFFAKKLNWCIDYHCTTCGARHFRSKIRELFNREQLIDQLKKLTFDFVDDRSNRDAMLLLLDDLGYPDYKNLIQELSGSASGEFLNRAIKIERDRREGHRERMATQQETKRKNQIIKAQENIWGAIKRKDLPAIKHLIAREIDLEQTNSDGLSLRAALKELGMEFM